VTNAKYLIFVKLLNVQETAIYASHVAVPVMQIATNVIVIAKIDINSFTSISPILERVWGLSFFIQLQLIDLYYYFLLLDVLLKLSHNILELTRIVLCNLYKQYKFLFPFLLFIPQRR